MALASRALGEGVLVDLDVLEAAATLLLNGVDGGSLGCSKGVVGDVKLEADSGCVCGAGDRC